MLKYSERGGMILMAEPVNIKKLIDAAARKEKCVAVPADSTDLPTLEIQFNDASLKLYDRYRAMVSLMFLVKLNLVPCNAVVRIFTKKLADQQDSELLRHEVAFVMGEIQGIDEYLDTLEQILKHDKSEVVRHEVAGALGNMWQSPLAAVSKAKKILQNCLQDQREKKIVRQTCELSLANLAWHEDNHGD